MAPRLSRKTAYTTNHDDFIQQFTQRENEKRRINKPKPRSAKERAALREKLKDLQFLLPDHADGTKINIAGILKKWKIYCHAAELGDWKESIKKLSRPVAQDFLDHLCERWKITSWSTSWIYWRQFKQLFTSVTGQFFNRNDNNEVRKWHDTVLVTRWGLRPPNVDGKPVLGTDDLLALQTFNLAYDDTVFPSERHRVQLLGCYLLLAFTGVRPGEIVDNEKRKPKDGSWQDIYGRKTVATEDSDDSNKDLDEADRFLEEMLSQETEHRGRPKALCYEDIFLSIVRHPETGKDVPTMSIKFIHHKGEDRKPKPTIFLFTGTRRLMFCIVTIIISLAISDEAFDAPSLKSVADVFKIRNRGPEQCQQLRWKQKWLKRPIFRGFEGSAVSPDKALPYDKLNDDMQRQTLDAGFEQAFGPRAFRRGAANKANGRASDAVRDQMMRHDPKWATFNSAYINEKVQFHLERVVADEPTEDCLIDLFTHMSMTRDPRASQNMVPAEVLRKLPPDPEIAQLEDRRDQLKKGRYRIQGNEHEDQIRELTKMIRTKRTQREKTLRKQYRQYYFYNRPTWEIERQLAGESDDEAEVVLSEPAIDLYIPERARLAKLLCHQRPDKQSYEEYCKLRIEVAELMVALSSKRETIKRKRVHKVSDVDAMSWNFTDVHIKEESPEPDRFPLLMLKTQCPRCIGDNALSIGERTFSYCRPAVMNDHFDREHLDTMKRSDIIVCNHPKCRDADLKLTSLDHFRNHVARVHGVNLRASRP
ncbi:FluG domain-containing protein [Pochonia chlamydosporia 170]|uniref:FluG domain-containing protein n=1 Tax=Pochonia chlamydosporia 170 TaxID=1380566 RepID=A0A179F009_METCM|nr:FluG domain-containing protein [Pochonia chlamydosporia 170]OAQ58761.1 FluG domain-containing protein [Pochonia chlamydosporia 170]